MHLLIQHHQRRLPECLGCLVVVIARLLMIISKSLDRIDGNNFDDRRQSPYDRKPNVLVAKRTAPPAPMSRQESIKRLQLKDLSLAGQLHTHTKPTKMNITLNTTNLPAANQVKHLARAKVNCLFLVPMWAGRTW